MWISKEIRQLSSNIIVITKYGFNLEIKDNRYEGDNRNYEVL